MTNLTIILISIVTLFGVFLVLRSIRSMQVCVLCASVLTTWLILLALFYIGNEIDPLIIGILMGGSIVGTMYLLEKKLPEAYAIFKLPFFLTLVVLTYTLLVKSISYQALVVLGVVWILSLVLFIKRDAKYFKALGKKIIECCKNW